MNSLQLSYREIVDILFDCDSDIDVVVDVISTNYSNISRDKIDSFKRFLVKTFVPRFKSKLKSVLNKKSRFLEKNDNWLSCSMYSFGEDYVDIEEPSCSNKVKRGRPVMTFEDSQERSKRYKVQQLCANTSAELITSAAKKIDKGDNTLTKLTPEKALSIILDANLSKFQYEIVRNATKELNINIFPSYKKVLLIECVLMFCIKNRRRVSNVLCIVQNIYCVCCFLLFCFTK